MKEYKDEKAMRKVKDTVKKARPEEQKMSKKKGDSKKAKGFMDFAKKKGAKK